MQTLLLVDDEPNIVEGLASQFEGRYGGDVIVLKSFSGLHALSILQNNKVDVVLSDIRMPDMDGLTATRRIRKKHIHVPIIALTAFAYDKDRTKALEAGCNEYITKPIQASLLKEMIKRFIN